MTLMDVLIRHKRMQGYQVRWQPGTDHAGIATQVVVEKQLLKEHQSLNDMTRDEFMARVWAWREQSGHTITQQMQRLGLAIDWQHERFSMDPSMSYATRHAFIQLYHEGLIYRGKRLVNWDPQLNTALSDLEVQTQEVDGELWTIRYPLVNRHQSILIATTRPETLFGDTAIAVHPEDTRYQSLIGDMAQLPLCHRQIPIIADDSVDREFGTGCVKITPAHDFSDYMMGKRHDLPMINIMTPQAELNDDVPEPYRGLSRWAARKKIIAALKDAHLLEKTEAHRLSLPVSERSGAVIEPRLTEQWFMRMKSMAQPAIDALKNGDLTFVPKGWESTYIHWLENIEDWCLSRQLWWGHSLPIWYDEEQNIYVGHDENDVREQYQLPTTLCLQQDSDVLDTWFSASLWPYATLGWPHPSNDYQTFYPTQVLVTGFDILFFWVARMVMMGIKLTGHVPFHTVYLTGLIRDHQGQKMSKSKGNILDPIDMIDGITLSALIKKRSTSLLNPSMADTLEAATRKAFPNGIAAYGTDALRFTYCALANTGRNINFDIGRIAGYQNFCNKLWNAARFVCINSPADPATYLPTDLTMVDRWILDRLYHLIRDSEAALAQYRFDLLAHHLYQFCWHEYCDWYLEFAKCMLYPPETPSHTKLGTQQILLWVLNHILRLLHPIIPFITEEIWHHLPRSNTQSSCLLATSYPEADDALLDSDAVSAVSWLKQMIITIRTIRSETGLSPEKQIPVILNRGNQQDEQYLKTMAAYIKKLAKAESLRWATQGDDLSKTATQVVGHLEIHIPLMSLIDPQAELQRLNKEITQLQAKEQALTERLSHSAYREKAPAHVVQKTEQALQDIQTRLPKLQAQYQHIDRMQQ